MVAGIVDGLRWLGLDWDEGPDVGGPHAPYFQSERLERYRATAEMLVERGRAYYCYCSPDSLKEKRKQAEARGEPWAYDGTCRRLPPDQVTELERSRAPRAVRFQVPAGTTSIQDLVHGTIEFDHAHIEDFVILRSDGHPTYHLSVVADDVEMMITHVVRGDDHISNTPKQVLLYEALGAAPPAFAHVPLILGPDKKRLSKRHGATSVMEYQRAGYLPEAMVNFLALLGWSPGGDREIFTSDELVAAFSLDAISGGNAVFNPEKLDWFNSQFIARLPIDDLARRVRRVLEEAGLWRDEYEERELPWFRMVLELIKPRVRRLPDFIDQGRPFLTDDIDYDPDAVKKYLTTPDLGQAVTALRAELSRTNPFDEASIECSLRSVADACGIKAGVLIHATRVGVTGRAVSPGLFEMLALLGRERTLSRLDRLRDYLSSAISGKRSPLPEV